MANKKIKNAVLILMLLSFTYLASSAIAAPETVADVANFMMKPVKSIDRLYLPFCYVSGLVLTIIGCLKLKEYSDTKGQSKLSTCILYIAAGATFVAFPTAVSIGKTMMGVSEYDSLHDDVRSSVGGGKSGGGKTGGGSSDTSGDAGSVY